MKNNIDASLSRNEDETEETTEPRDLPRAFRSADTDSDSNEIDSRSEARKAIAKLDFAPSDADRDNPSTDENMSVTAGENSSSGDKEIVARRPSPPHCDPKAQQGEKARSDENPPNEDTTTGVSSKESRMGVVRDDSFPQYHEFRPSLEQSRNEVKPSPKETKAAVAQIKTTDKKGSPINIIADERPTTVEQADGAPRKRDSSSTETPNLAGGDQLRGDREESHEVTRSPEIRARPANSTEGYSNDGPVTISDSEGVPSTDDIRRNENETTQEERPDDRNAPTESNDNQRTFLDYPQVRPGAVAVAGPARNEGDEERRVIPKRILAERLQGAAERASDEITNDGAHPLEAAIQPGAIAVPGPDADDSRNEERVVTPKRMLAERLQHAVEREEKTDMVDDDDEGQQSEETASIEQLNDDSSAGRNEGRVGATDQDGAGATDQDIDRDDNRGDHHDERAVDGSGSVQDDDESYAQFLQSSFS